MDPDGIALPMLTREVEWSKENLEDSFLFQAGAKSAPFGMFHVEPSGSRPMGVLPPPQYKISTNREGASRDIQHVPCSTWNIVA